MSIEWSYLAGFKFNKGFHYMYNAYFHGLEIRKECSSQKDWYYILEDDQIFEDIDSFEKHLKEYTTKSYHKKFIKKKG
jgi:hypothetical protein